MNLRTRNFANSEALFGSAARGDSDRLSDRDYLIVDDDTSLLKARADELRSEGCSVASYTFAKVDALARAGALFLQHIKDESAFLTDRGDRLHTLLSNFRPKGDYALELVANARLAALITTRPEGAEGALWAADVLFVTLRNFGVLRLAELGSYVFAYADVIDRLIEVGELSPEGRSPLLKLRLLKTLYRSEGRFSSHQIESSLTMAIQHLPQMRFPLQSRSVSADEILLSAKTAPANANAYERLRNLEKVYIAAGALCPAFRRTEEAQKLLSWIRNPRAYAQWAGQLESEQLSSLRKLLASVQVRKIA